MKKRQNTVWPAVTSGDKLQWLFPETDPFPIQLELLIPCAHWNHRVGWRKYLVGPISREFVRHIPLKKDSRIELWYRCREEIPAS